MVSSAILIHIRTFFSFSRRVSSYLDAACCHYRSVLREELQVNGGYCTSSASFGQSTVSLVTSIAASRLARRRAASAFTLSYLACLHHLDSPCFHSSSHLARDYLVPPTDPPPLPRQSPTPHQPRCEHHWCIATEQAPAPNLRPPSLPTSSRTPNIVTALLATKPDLYCCHCLESLRGYQSSHLSVKWVPKGTM